MLSAGYLILSKMYCDHPAKSNLTFSVQILTGRLPTNRLTLPHIISSLTKRIEFLIASHVEFHLRNGGSAS